MQINQHRPMPLLLLFLFVTTLQAQPKLPFFKVTKCDTGSRGYYFFSPVKVGPDGPEGTFKDLILDHKGKVVYINEYDQDFKGGNLRLHPNKQYSYFYDKRFYVMDSLFRPVDTVNCQNGYELDTHEFLILPNGNYVVIGTEFVTMDLSTYFIFKKNQQQGLPNAKVRCNVIQELDRNKNVVFEWHGKEHYKFDDVDTAYIDKLYDIDWMHMNSVEYDRDGNYIISLKHFNEITKINRKTGEIMWRLGGKRNQFAFINDSLKFCAQHDVRRIANRNITFFDNGSARGTFHPETAKEYRVDEKNKTVTLVWSHINNPKTCSDGLGSVQRLPNKNTLVNYGRSPEGEVIFNVLMYNGRKVFEVQTTDGLKNYRAFNEWKLPAPLPRPVIKAITVNGQLALDAGEGHSAYYWSSGETTRIIVPKKFTEYHVYVPFGPGGYLSSEIFDISTVNKSGQKNH